MRILETTELDQVSGAGLLGLNPNLGANVLGILGIRADADVDIGGSGRGHSNNHGGRNDHGRSNCYGRDTRRRCY
ncbi:MAG: hypothetical protein ACTHM8_02445 [Sphingomonas sp.]